MFQRPFHPRLGGDDQPVERRDQQKRRQNQNQDAALQLFTAKGLDQTSISDITDHSGVAKAFYLYFKDKYDIRNKLVIYQSRRLLGDACEAMLREELQELDEQFVFIANHVLDQLAARQELLILIAKNLSWGFLKQAPANAEPVDDENTFVETFHSLTAPYDISRADSEILLYLVVELISSSCYSAILYGGPCDLETLKPHLFESVRRIVRQFTGECP